MREITEKAALAKIDEAIGIDKRIDLTVEDLRRKRNRLMLYAQRKLSYRRIAELMGRSKAWVIECLRQAREDA